MDDIQKHKKGKQESSAKSGREKVDVDVVAAMKVRGNKTATTLEEVQQQRSWQWRLNFKKVDSE